MGDRARGQALEGVKVLDFTWVLYGPLVTKYLADHGAQVVKIESRTRPDILRLVGPFVGGVDHPDHSALMAVANSSKYSLALNLRNPEATEVVERLVRWCDVVTENFNVGTLEKMGLGYDRLRELNPEVILVSMSIAGQTGALSKFAGFGPHAAALAGLYSVSGWPDGEPTGSSDTWPDVIAPWFAVVAILAALEYRERTGKGQWIDASQIESTIHGLGPAILDYCATGRVQGRQGNRSPNAAPHGVFRCAGEDRWCAVAVYDDEEWKSLCRVMGRSELIDDSRFSTLEGRRKHEEELERIVEEWTAGYPPEIVAERLQEAGVPAGLVANGRDLTEDPQLGHRNYYERPEHPTMGPCIHPGWPAKLSRTPYQIRPSPTLGEHNRYVLCELLGMSNDEIEALTRAGAFE